MDGEEVTVKKFAAAPVPTKLEIEADGTTLIADGNDATRVVFKVVDQVGNILPYLNEVIEFEIEGSRDLDRPESDRPDPAVTLPPG